MFGVFLLRAAHTAPRQFMAEDTEGLTQAVVARKFTRLCDVGVQRIYNPHFQASYW